ncbi:membrane protein [Halogranum rubrum]|uniref:Membrane protein n=1 Tax=Halogranum rubrum TaxID=553466 RepID=A0A1I4HB77_9EURY|nr:YihY/virulence factor BrkB family protein [Halogranum rubrum]SFL39539.1 membrane protein [Halogranum rubrum]
MLTGSRVVAAVRAIGAEFSEKNVTFMAGSIAYNAFVSLAPLLVVLLLAVNVLNSDLESQVLTLANQYLTPSVSRLVERVVDGDSSTTSASVIGLVVSLWGSLKIFRNLDTAFSEIFESDVQNSFTDQLRDGLVVLFALLVGVVGMVFATAAFSYFEWVPYVGLLSPVSLFVGLCVAFFPLFYVFPDVDLEPHEVLPGVVVAAVGWAILQGVFQVYTIVKGGSDAALLGTLILVVTWLYFSGIVLLLGAIVNAVLTGNAGNLVDRRTGMSSTAETERDLTTDDAAPYLAVLREDVTGRYVGMRPTKRTRPVQDGGRRRPRPSGRIHVEEHTVETLDGSEWEVTLRYPYESKEETETKMGW